jgi:hypothetical protein
MSESCFGSKRTFRRRYAILLIRNMAFIEGARFGVLERVLRVLMVVETTSSRETKCIQSNELVLMGVKGLTDEMLQQDLFVTFSQTFFVCVCRGHAFAHLPVPVSDCDEDGACCTLDFRKPFKEFDGLTSIVRLLGHVSR